jgi:hypothetical protein
MSPDKATAEPAEPWRSFLRELDACLTGQVELRCFSGFVVAQHYGLGRETSDIDFVAAITESRADDLEHLAGMHSRLHRKYRLYLQHVGIATPPSDYAQRLTHMFPKARPKGFEPLTTWFEEACSERRKSLENKEFWHLGCATEPPVTP